MRQKHWKLLCRKFEEGLTHPVVEEDKLHLHEGEYHAGRWGEGLGHAATVGADLEELAELQARVDHAPDTERCNRIKPSIR